MKENNSNIGDFTITRQLREKLKWNPDERVAFNGTVYSILYGEREALGRTRHTAYCTIEKDDKPAGEIFAMATSREDAQKALGHDIFKLIKLTEKEREKRR